MKDTIKIIPLGGFDKIGMNMTIIESDESIIIVDCGTSFPPNDMPGIDTSIPDISYLKEHKEKVKGIVVTHGHEDHIGAIPYVLPELDIPIYGTPLTILLIEDKLKRYNINKPKTKVIRQGNTFILGDFKIEFIKTNHSIPDAVMLAIYTVAGIIVCTGDFKIDLTPTIGDTTDLRRLAAIGSKGVLAVLSDSTNALIKGSSPSENEVSISMDRLFNNYKNERLIIATFASNMDRVSQIIDISKKYGRKVILQGDVMLEIFKSAEKLGYISLQNDVLIEPDEASCYKDSELVFLTTGNHGEPISCLSDIANGLNENIKIKESDVILFSSIPVQGYESIFSETINSLEEQGAKILFRDLHVTGHACIEELKLIYNLLSPKYIIPAHGQFRIRNANKEIAISCGIPEENVLMIKNGDILKISESFSEVTGSIELKEILVDGLGIGDISGQILSERKAMSQAGVVIVTLCFSHGSKRLIAPPSIVTQGFVNRQKSASLILKLTDDVSSEVSRMIAQDIDSSRFETNIKRTLQASIWKKTMRKPLIIVNVTEAVI
ncbi:ribonuclease J [Butyrivibrio proteoclasticus]|uniref:Ribonuclease J n=1 Tax=Butyrivibrio proteoclasticus TaxID=43305 RepID=A0A1I5U3B9_9FIRM|nr:ribonuclease J [Butyrivibrio proteoclasticus]SFP89818.1 ribonuclease J [Butyrivibrio proteoclasticus]